MMYNMHVFVYIHIHVIHHRIHVLYILYENVFIFLEFLEIIS